jgi:hypothetical protein
LKPAKGQGDGAVDVAPPRVLKHIVLSVSSSAHATVNREIAEESLKGRRPAWSRPEEGEYLSLRKYRCTKV